MGGTSPRQIGLAGQPGQDPARQEGVIYWSGIAGSALNHAPSPSRTPAPPGEGATTEDGQTSYSKYP
jgi:hypothetical protein